LQHLGRAIAYVWSPSGTLQIGNWKSLLAAMRVPFPELTYLRLFSHIKTLPVISYSFLGGICPTSSGNLHLVWHSISRNCQNSFCLLLTLSTLHSLMSFIPDTFHPKRSSLSSPCCPAMNGSPLYSNPLYVALTAKLDVFLHQNVLSSPL
jgi:hypothetical protein